MKKLLMIALFSGYSAYGVDLLQVDAKGKVNLFYVEKDQVWMRTCESHAIVESLSTCKASEEVSLGKTSIVKQNLASRIAGVNGTYDFHAGNLKDIQKEIKQIEEFKNKYGKSELPILEDKTIDIVKYRSLKESESEVQKKLDKLKKVQKIADDVVNKVILKGFTVVNTSDPSAEYEKAVSLLGKSSLPLVDDYSVGFEVGKCNFQADAPSRRFILKIEDIKKEKHVSHTHSDCYRLELKYSACLQYQISSNECLPTREVIVSNSSHINDSGKDLMKDDSSSARGKKKSQKASKQ